MRVRVLVEQHANPALGRARLLSGHVYDVDAQWAKELLAMGAAEAR